MIIPLKWTAERPKEPVLMIDGSCVLCHGATHWLLRRNRRILVAALQDEVGVLMAKELGLPRDLDTVWLLRGDKAYGRSDAVLRVLSDLGGLWRLTAVFWLVPEIIRDALYAWIARNRMAWFGARDQCSLPDKALREQCIENVAQWMALKQGVIAEK